MRIAINASLVDHPMSGLGVYAVNITRELAKVHDDLIVYTSCPELCGVSSEKVRSITRRTQPCRGRKGHFQRVAWAQAVLPLRLLAERASLLFSPVPEGMLFSFVPQVVVVHDVLPLHFAEEYPRQQYYFRYFVPVVLRRSLAMVADSESTKRDLVASYGIASSRVHVVPGGYDQSRYRVGTEAEIVKKKYGLGVYLLYVGNLLPHKNLRRLLYAFALIMRRIPHRLVIAGKKDPRYYPALETEARAVGLEGRVSFLDYVSPQELPALYGGAEAFILPSLYEGFGLPVLEAMACNTPVIASHAGSLPEVTGDAAVLVDPYDVRGMAEAIGAVLEDPGMREAMRRKGLEQARRFSWRRTATMVLEILRRVGNR